MKNTTTTTTKTPVLQPDQHGIIDKTVVFLTANKKAAIYITAAILALAAAFAVYAHQKEQAYQKQWANLFKAELEFVSSSTQSLTPLEQFVEQNKGTAAATYATLTLGDAYYQTQDFAKAMDYFKSVSASDNKQLAALADVSIIATDIAVKNYTQAISAADAFAAKNPTHFSLGQVLQYKALAQELSGNAKDAKESYTKLSMQYPNTYYSAFADLRLKELK